MAKTPHQKGLFLLGAGGDGRRVRRPEPRPPAVSCCCPPPTPWPGAKRFAFAASTGTPLLPALADDWCRYGRDCFVFEVLETLTREPEQAEAQFRAELDVTRLSARGASFY